MTDRLEPSTPGKQTFPPDLGAPDCSLSASGFGEARPLARRGQMRLRLLDQLFHGYSGPNFLIQSPDHAMWVLRPSEPTLFSLIVKRDSVWSALLSADELILAECYLQDALDIQGDLISAFAVADFLLAKSRTRTLWGLLAYLQSLCARGNHPRRLRGVRHTPARDKEAIAFHYDISNAFYTQWLDPQMVYSCAYFEREDEGLEAAQTRKLDYICRKLRLAAGERLLDVGCGWGALIRHATKNYGVRALGITLSRSQQEFANEEIHNAGLQASCEVRLCDYRELRSDSFDKISSVGMFEHVGSEQLEKYFQCMFTYLRPGGVFLNHGISLPESDSDPKKPTFMRRYVFPDGELLPIWTIMESARNAGFELRDVESLREHYYLTLRHWVNRLENHSAMAREACGERTFRIWRLYMAGSAYRFRAGQLGLYQTLLYKPGGAHLPLTRRDWYE